jgi:hypothetical protein
MAKSQKKSGRETRKPKHEQPTGKKIPRYLREGGASHLAIPEFTPAKKSAPAK